ncbi:hypothetical protein X769_13740 [Mesorhizobium sp. LSJC268A00]|nr:hypothetical protein X769_13740 [Mesorhizobium sp. LSJC268A00]
MQILENYGGAGLVLPGPKGALPTAKKNEATGKIATCHENPGWPSSSTLHVASHDIKPANFADLAIKST